MKPKEQLKKEIKSIEDEIEIIKKHNEYSGELSFYFYQLHLLKEQLKQLKSLEKYEKELKNGK